MLHRALPALAGIALLVAASTAQATVTISVIQGKAVRVADANGMAVERIFALDGAVPGDVIVYRYMIRNGGARPAEGVTVNTAVPDNMVYRAGSARPGTAQADVLLSADHGRTFAPEGRVMVLDIDDTWRPARPEDITHLRWRLPGPVAPSAVEGVEYHAVLR